MKLFITDIDDTLSVGEAVADEVRGACSRLRGAGWEIMVATGRTYSTARGHMEAIGVTHPSILYNGGRIVDPSGRPLYSPSPAGRRTCRPEVSSQMLALSVS